MWEGGVGDPPGAVLCLVAGVENLDIGFWPTCTLNSIEIGCWIAGPFSIGYFGDWPGMDCPFFTCADENGFGGNPWTCIAPGIGYPTGWQPAATVWPNCVSLGIGFTYTEVPPIQRPCCVGTECHYVQERECDDLHGEWHPEWSGCGPPNPCAGGGPYHFVFNQLSPSVGCETPLQYSDIGMVTITFTPEERAFMNVAVSLDGVRRLWCGQNVFLPSREEGQPTETVSIRFPLSELEVDPGEPVSSLLFGWSTSTDPLLDSDAPAWMGQLNYTRVSVANVVEQAEGAPVVDVPTDSIAGLIRWFPPFLPPIQLEVDALIGCAMPYFDLAESTHAGDLYGCAPASCASSLKWLDDKHAQVDFPPGIREAYQQLANLMKKLPGRGPATWEDVVRGKLDIIEAYNLPIHVKHQSSEINGAVKSTSGLTESTDGDATNQSFPTLDWLRSEARAGEDVELSICWGYEVNGTICYPNSHNVVLTGAMVINRVPVIWFKDDRDQNGEGGTRQQASTISVADSRMYFDRMATWIWHDNAWRWCWARVDQVISESYEPRPDLPPAHTFSGYCQEFRRTIAPGQKLVITYPPDPRRCLNTTVNEYDRTVNTAVWKKKHVWNGNSGRQRQYVNNTPNCMTIAVHNDDCYRDQGGQYVNYTVDLAIMPAGVREESSPDNPDEYGGFSLGAQNGDASEFGEITAPSVIVDCEIGCVLADVPRTLGAEGVECLNLRHAIPQWNPYWGHVGLQIAVLTVDRPGNLEVRCPVSGYDASTRVDTAGVYFIDLGAVTTTQSFEVALETIGATQFCLDGIGVPSLVPYELSDAGIASIPLALRLLPGRPNPFHDETVLAFDLPIAGEVDLGIFDASGRRLSTLVSGHLAAGSHEVAWTGLTDGHAELRSGVYFYRLRAGQVTLTGRVTRVR